MLPASRAAGKMPYAQESPGRLAKHPEPSEGTQESAVLTTTTIGHRQTAARL